MKKEEVEADKAIAVEKVGIERMKANNDIEIKQAQKDEKVSEDLLPKVTETMTAMVQMMQEMVSKNEETMSKMLEVATGEREAVIRKDKDGNIIGASSKIVRH